METKNFILASGSKQRIALLESIGFTPKKIIPADIDESIKKGENPTAYAKRMAYEKALKIASQNKGEVILAADTVGFVSGKYLYKAASDEEQAKMMKMLSGKSSRIITAVCVINKEGKISLKVNVNKVTTKKLSVKEIKEYVDGHSWVGCCGYKIETFDPFVKKIIGSYSGIIGLPLYEARNMLIGAGIK